MKTEWLACLIVMWEVSQLNPASYLCWNIHVGKQLAAMQATKRSTGVIPEANLSKCISHIPPPSRIRLPTLALKPRGNVTRSPKQVYQRPHKKDLCPPKFFVKKVRIPCCSPTVYNAGRGDCWSLFTYIMYRSRLNGRFYTEVMCA